jgi:hypothetical protein
VPLEDFVDRGHRDIDLVKALEVEADPDGPILPLRTDTEDEGHDVRWRGELRVSRARLEVLQSLEPLFLIARSQV